VLRNGQKWSELGLRSDRPLDVTEAIRKVNALEMPARPPCIQPRLNPTHRSGNIVLRLDDVQFGYPNTPLFRADGVELHRGECVALIGPNGSGKTTFIRTLLHELQPLEGQLYLGASLKIGYFAQAHDDLKSENTVIDELLRHKGMAISAARNYLAGYLFRGDDVFKPVRALSGGERSRLALAILALEGANFLLLDEPTNHLDLPAQEVLQELLQHFPGTIMMVSHDRYLVDRLATQIWELRDSRLNVYQGSYRQFVMQRAELNESVRKIIFTPKPLVRDNSKETRKQQQALERLEARIQEKEKTMRRLNSALQKSGNGKPFEQIHQLSREFAKVQSEMEDLMAEWETIVA
jgi:ATP-binding cassette subfamily F protein 3